MFRYTEEGVAWWRDNGLGIRHIYPANAITLDSDTELLNVAQNTIDEMQRWQDFNTSSSFFVAAIRVGYDPSKLLNELHKYALYVSVLPTSSFMAAAECVNLAHEKIPKIHSYLLNFIADILKDTPVNQLTASVEISKLNPSLKFMNDEFRHNPSLEVIALKSNLAPNYFHRIFKKNFGLTPYSYMLRLRMEHAIKLLTTTDKSVKEIAFESGYTNEFYFYRQFKKQYKYSPGTLKKLRPF